MIGKSEQGMRFELPPEVQTIATAVLGIRGSGKSHTASVEVENQLDRGSQVVIIDPTDGWHGLRSSADGKKAGYPIMVLGGEHGDEPIGGDSGRVVADFLVEQPVSVILSLRHLPKSQQRHFVTDFAEQLYHRKGASQYRTPLLVVIDECDTFIPQRVTGGEARMVGAIEDLVRRGRNAGIGVMLISQRAASINKDVLTQIELLVAHRHTSPQDRKALQAWVEAHDTEGRAQQFLADLASLPRGTAYFWSPGWLDVFERVQVRQRRTFDSSATPRPGQRAITPQKTADIDLEALRMKLAGTIEKAKADDPKALRARIAELERQLRDRSPVEPERVEIKVPFVPGPIVELTKSLQHTLDDLKFCVEASRKQADEMKLASVSQPEIVAKNQISRPISPPSFSGSMTNTKLCKAERLILGVLAQFQTRTKSQIALQAGYSVNGGGFNNALSRLRSSGLIDGSGDSISITAEGTAAAGPVEPLPRGADLLNHWQRQLGRAERAILGIAYNQYPKTISKDDLGRVAGYEPSGGGFNNALSRLRTLELISGRGDIRISEVFFE